MGRLRLTEAEYQLSQNGVVSEGCNAEVDRTSGFSSNGSEGRHVLKANKLRHRDLRMRRRQASKSTYFGAENICPHLCRHYYFTRITQDHVSPPLRAQREQVS